MLNRYGFQTLRIAPAGGDRAFAPGVSESALTLTSSTIVYLRPGILEAITINLPDSAETDRIELHDLASVVPNAIVFGTAPASSAAKAILRPGDLVEANSRDLPLAYDFKQGMLILCHALATADITLVYRSRGRTAPTAPGVFIARR